MVRQGNVNVMMDLCANGKVLSPLMIIAHVVRKSLNTDEEEDTEIYKR